MAPEHGISQWLNFNKAAVHKSQFDRWRVVIISLKLQALPLRIKNRFFQVFFLLNGTL